MKNTREEVSMEWMDFLQNGLLYENILAFWHNSIVQ